MAFIRTKKVKGKKYRYKVENYRDSKTGKVRQRTLEYLGAVEDETMVTTDKKKLITFEQYLKYEDGTNSRYELVDGELVLMPAASFLHSDLIDFIADLFKAYARENNLDMKVKTGDVGVRTGINSSRIPDISVIDGIVWRSMPRDASAVIEVPLLLAVEVVSPGAEQIERDYKDKVSEYQNSGIGEYWIVDPIQQKITVLVLEKEGYAKTVFVKEDLMASEIFPQLRVTAAAILSLD